MPNPRTNITPSSNFSEEDFDKAKAEYPLLTFKQRVFVEQYVRTGEAKNSAITAGFKPKSAGQIANILLKKPMIKNIIQCRQALINGALHITREGLLMQLVDMKDKSFSKGDVGATIKLVESISKLLGFFDTRAFNLTKIADNPMDITISTPIEKGENGKLKNEKLNFDQPLLKDDPFYLGDEEEPADEDEVK